MQQKREFFVDALHIFILSSFALAQPLFDLLSRNAEFFVARHSKSIDVILLILILCVLFPSLLVLMEVVAALFGRRIRKGIHYFMVAGLFAVIALPALKKILEIPGTTLLVGATILGVVVTITYIRLHLVRMFLTVLSPALLIFPGLFLFNSPVFKVVFPKKDPLAVTVKIANSPPIVMVVFDELPLTSLMDKNHMIDQLRYPSFATLAEDAYWFRNASALAGNTEIALPPILTGNYPPFRFPRLPTASDYPNNIFTLLGGSYDVKALEPITNICPEQLCGDNTAGETIGERMQFLVSDLSIVYLHILLPSEFTSKLPSITLNWTNFKDRTTNLLSDNVLNKKDIKYSEQYLQKFFSRVISENNNPKVFRQFVNSIHSTKKPTLYFLHTTLPHRPWDYLPSGKQYISYGRLDCLVKEIWCEDEWQVIQVFQRHLLQLGFANKLLGELIAKLKDEGLYKRSLIIVTADHGVSFRPNDYTRPATKTNYQDILPVPLFIKLPNQEEGVISDRNVELVDILPTIADVLGIEVPWPIDGRSVFDHSQPERKEKFVFKNVIKLTFETFIDTKHESLNRKLSLFGDGTIPDGLFKIGPHNELVGRNVSEIGVTGQADVYIQFDRPFLFDNVDLSAFIPAQITGRVLQNMGTSEPLALAVAVNGVISAVSQPYLNKKKEMEFSAIASESAFRSGKNEVEVFLVSKNNNRLVISKTKNRPVETYTLTSSEFIVPSNGKSVQITRDGLKGYLDLAAIKGDNVLFSGWAVDIKEFRPADTIAIFLNGKFLYSGCCNQDRPDLVKAYKNSDMLRAGFKFNIPLSLFKDIGNSEVRIFAISKKGIASELNYPKGYKWGKKS